MSKSESLNAFEKLYPKTAEWVESYGWIEMGYDDFNQSFVRALNIGGMIWEGQYQYASVEDAMQDLEVGISTWMEENL
jgi:hypothetical protein